jgi:hypothetical protein
MFSYCCPSCGASAYSSAGAATVGRCPGCAQPLGEPDTPLDVSPTTVRGEALPLEPLAGIVR